MIVIAARDSSASDRAGADIVCDGRSDVAVLAKALAEPDREVVLTAGQFDVNAGTAPDGTRYLRPAVGVTIRGAGPGLTRLVAEREPCRIAVDAPGVTLANLGGYGYVGVRRADPLVGRLRSILMGLRPISPMKALRRSSRELNGDVGECARSGVLSV